MNMDGTTASQLGTAPSEDRPITTGNAHTSSIPINEDAIMDSASSACPSECEDHADDLYPSQLQDQVQVDHHAIFKRAEQALLTHGTPALMLQVPNGDFLCQLFRPQAWKSEHEGQFCAHI
jgi:hypothetical protein